MQQGHAAVSACNQQQAVPHHPCLANSTASGLPKLLLLMLPLPLHAVLPCSAPNRHQQPNTCLRRRSTPGWLLLYQCQLPRCLPRQHPLLCCLLSACCLLPAPKVLLLPLQPPQLCMFSRLLSSLLVPSKKSPAGSGSPHQEQRPPARARTFLEPEGSLMRVMLASGLWATMMA